MKPVLFVLNLRGGAGDYACRACLTEAKRDHEHSLVSTAPIDVPGERCGWCGVEQEAPARSVLS